MKEAEDELIEMRYKKKVLNIDNTKYINKSPGEHII